MKYQSALRAKLIYVFRINDEAHKGCLKIGDATLSESASLDLKPNCRELNQAAKARIAQYTKTASIDYDLLHTESTIYITGGTIGSFTDGAVHDVLKRSGIKRHDFSTDNQGKEWFECDLETVKRAITAVKQGKTSLDANEISEGQNPIVFRPEQKEAIKKTVKKFEKRGTHMLWNAKMRFGKTLSSLQVVKECQFQRTLILTHRPVVDAGWFEDFNKIFLEKGSIYRYGSKNNGFTFENLESELRRHKDWKYVYFASMQDLRGSEQAGGKFDKNNEIFQTQWDCLIIDEAHEGTQTQLGQNVIELLKKDATCTLNLSGTPFNLLDDFNEDEVYTWDYVMEQQAKAQWDIDHFGDPNPYAGLPRMNIFTFDLGKIVSGYADVEDSAFNFKEFFRTWTGDPGRDHVEMPAGKEVGKFVHEKDVKSFLDLIVKYDKESNYPYSTEEYRRNFRHSLWMVPGVKEARALSDLLKRHNTFGKFEIVNVAGDGDEEAESDEALKMVNKAMGPNPEETYTITLSCGRLTTGVTVRPWTAVFMLAGSAQTDAKAYMQTIFRVQSPYETKDGKRKEECFVFDFAPDRTLKVIAQVAKVSTRRGKIQTDSDKAVMGRFLNFCPIIGYNGTKMQTYDVDNMLEQLKKAYIDRVVKHGFEDPYLYNDNLLKLSKVELEKFKNLKAIIGATKASHSTDSVDVNKQGLDDEKYEELEKLEKKKKKRELTEEEKRLLEELKEQKKQRSSAISILRGISIRFPLLIYGCELSDNTQDVTIDNFSLLIDDDSWEEFMPKGVTKEYFKEFIQYYDPEIFRASGRKIREMAKAADTLAPKDRVKRIAEIFACFRNPDKETVLTPWRVVNMHMSDCLGGWDFMDEKHEKVLDAPRFVDQGEVTKDVFNAKTRILEINSKTGLYPLYVTYSVFAERCRAYREKHMLSTDLTDDIQQKLWDKTLAENIFVICKTPMAKSITRRTLHGFREKVKVNAHYFEDLINQIKNKPEQFIKRVSNGAGYWKSNNESNMKFNAIIGNPPYQKNIGAESNSSYAASIYNYFIDVANLLSPKYISLITPSRWMTKASRGISDEWVDKMLVCNHFVKLHDFVDATDCFRGVEIKGGISYWLLQPDYIGKCLFVLHKNKQEFANDKYLDEAGSGIVIRDPMAANIISDIEKVEGKFYIEKSFSQIVGPRAYFTDIDKNILTANWSGYKTKQDKTHNIKYYLNKRLNASGIAWISYDDIPKGHISINLNKVYVPKAGGSGDDPIVIGTPFYGEPGSVCSDTYLCIGYNADNPLGANECKHIVKYMKSRFFRFMLSVKKKTQNTTRDTYQFVPLQDFTKDSDIDWSKSVEDIDKQLYKKYKLTEEEIAYIESLIKPME